MKHLPFAICPMELFFDSTLTKTQLRVLGAILTFRNRNTNLARPKRDKLSKRLGGMAETRISQTTSELVKLGWLKKTGKGGFSKATEYQFMVPKHITETVTESVTVTKPVTVTKSVTKTVTESVTGKEQTIEHTNIEKKNKKKKKLDFSEIDPPKNLHLPTWQSWMKYKNQINKPYKTEQGIKTAMNQLATLTQEQQEACIDSSIANEYQGFFIDKFKGNNNAKRESSFEREEREHQKYLQERERLVGNNEEQIPLALGRTDGIKLL